VRDRVRPAPISFACQHLFPHSPRLWRAEAIAETIQASVHCDSQNARTNQLHAFINEVAAQSGVHTTPDAAAALIADANWILNGCTEQVGVSVDEF